MGSRFKKTALILTMLLGTGSHAFASHRQQNPKKKRFFVNRSEGGYSGNYNRIVKQLDNAMTKEGLPKVREIETSTGQIDVVLTNGDKHTFSYEVLSKHASGDVVNKDRNLALGVKQAYDTILNNIVVEVADALDDKEQ